MLHITCDLCGKELLPGDDHRFVARGRQYTGGFAVCAFGPSDDRADTHASPTVAGCATEQRYADGPSRIANLAPTDGDPGSSSHGGGTAGADPDSRAGRADIVWVRMELSAGSNSGADDGDGRPIQHFPADRRSNLHL